MSPIIAPPINMGTIMFIPRSIKDLKFMSDKINFICSYDKTSLSE